MKAAEDMLLRALDGYQTIYGPDHEFVVITTGALGLLYHSHDRWEEAEGMYLSALDVSQRCSAHEGAFYLRCHLGMLFEERSMFEKAIQHFELASEGYTNLFGPEHKQTIDCMEQLSECQQRLEAEKGISHSIPENCDSVSE